MPPLTIDATTALLRAIRARFGEFDSFVLEEIVSRTWASATFLGARHVLQLRLRGPEGIAAADRFLDGLEAAEFRLRGHILADIALVARDRLDDSAIRLRIEALTVEDG